MTGWRAGRTVTVQPRRRYSRFVRLVCALRGHRRIEYRPTLEGLSGVSLDVLTAAGYDVSVLLATVCGRCGSEVPRG